MKRSYKIILGTLFSAAVSAAAKGKDMYSRGDSSSRHSVNGAASRAHGGFFNFLRPHHSNSSNSRPRSHAPRTGGFGNTVRSASS